MKAFLVFSLFVAFMSATCAHDLEEFYDGPGKTGFVKCKSNLYRCFKDGKDKKKCINDFKICMEAPIPHYKKECYRIGRECLSSAGGIKEKHECAKKIGTCLKLNRVSTQTPTATTTR